MVLTLQGMIDLEPRLDQWRGAARQAARNAWEGWGEWFQQSAQFNALFGPDASCEALRNQDARENAVRMLVDLFNRERRRAQRAADDWFTIGGK